MAQTYKYTSNDNYDIYVEVVNDEIYHMFFHNPKNNTTLDIPINANTSSELYHTAVMVVEDGTEITDNYDLL